MSKAEDKPVLDIQCAYIKSGHVEFKHETEHSRKGDDTVQGCIPFWKTRYPHPFALR